MRPSCCQPPRPKQRFTLLRLPGAFKGTVRRIARLFLFGCHNATDRSHAQAGVIHPEVAGDAVICVAIEDDVNSLARLTAEVNRVVMPLTIRGVSAQVVTATLDHRVPNLDLHAAKIETAIIQ